MSQLNQITLYSDENCGGDPLVITENTLDLENNRFLARAKSLVVSGDPWVVYTEINYGGKYELYRVGIHNTIPGFADKICSLRMVVGGLSNPKIILYEQPRYGSTGIRATLTQEALSLTTYNLNNKVSASKVQSGAWQLFQEEDCSGPSMVMIASDEKPDFGNIGWANRVSSAKPYQ